MSCYAGRDHLPAEVTISGAWISQRSQLEVSDREFIAMLVVVDRLEAHPGAKLILGTESPHWKNDPQDQSCCFPSSSQ